MPLGERSMPRKPEDLAIYAAPALFVVLWASGFVGAKFGLPYVEPLTFLTIRMIAVVSLLAIVASLTRPTWPDMPGIRHSVVAGLLVHGVYLGGVFVSIDRRLPAGLSALVVSLQPVLTSTIANRFSASGWSRDNGSASRSALPASISSSRTRRSRAKRPRSAGRPRCAR